MIETLFTAFFTVCMMLGVYVVCSAIAKAIIKIIDSIKTERQKGQVTCENKKCDNCHFGRYSQDNEYPCSFCARNKILKDNWCGTDFKEVSDD